MQAFLTSHFQLRRADFSQLASGRPVVRSLDTTDGREIATLGVIRVGVPPEFYVDQLRNIVTFKRDEAVRQIGTFGVPARLADVERLTLHTDDVNKLRRCRLGDCKVQLSADAIQRFQREVDWSAPDAAASATGVIQAILGDLVNAYRASGDSALMTYADERRPLALAEEFRAMTATPPALVERFPPLHRHLQLFPRGGDETIEDILYWSKEQLGPALIVSVTHLAIAPLTGGPAAFAVASKQIYGTHYFDASLG